MPGSWFEEQDPFSPVRYRYPIEEVLHRRTTPYQHIEVLRSSFFGRMLVLNGVVQLTERDEFVYHEMLVHVPMHVHPGPERVLIVGGGDGGALREALRHPGVTVTLAELDPEVVEVSRAYFPALAESFDSPRATVAYGDAADYVADAGERFDVVLCDLTDPVGPARKLSERPFFEALKRILAPGGVVSMQTESLHFHAGHVKRVQKALRSVFPHTALYGAPIATYAGNWWTFSMASLAAIEPEPRRTVPGVRLYSAAMHRAAFIPDAVLECFAGLDP